MANDDNENINFFLDETEDSHNDILDLSEFLNITETENNELTEKKYDILFMTHTVNYQINYTVKQLMLICDFYGISKGLKAYKCNKDEIINILINFENETMNQDIVFRRHNMWFYINELKNDKFMKKYVLW